MSKQPRDTWHDIAVLPSARYEVAVHCLPKWPPIRPPISQGVLLTEFGVDVRADAGSYDHNPHLMHFVRAATGTCRHILLWKNPPDLGFMPGLAMGLGISARVAECFSHA